MLNGVNNSEDIFNSQIEKHNEISKVVTNPIRNPYQKIDENLLIDETAISSQAIRLYQNEQDVKKFTNLAMSNPENLSHEEIVASLFQKGVLDPLSDDVIAGLSQNEKLWNDLAL